jgi:hypothetical protein
MRHLCGGVSTLVDAWLGANGTGKPLWMVFIVASFAGSFMTPAYGSSLLTYEVNGAFTDRGTFSGTFGYDPITNSYTDEPPGVGDQFTISTSAGGQGQGVYYTPFQPPVDYSDEGSSATELYILGGDNFGSAILTLDWKIALNTSAGGNLQPITGGSENLYTVTFGCFPSAYCVTTLDDRQVASGYVELVQPVPLPAAAWLFLTGVAALAGLVKPSQQCRRVRVRAQQCQGSDYRVTSPRLP